MILPGHQLRSLIAVADLGSYTHAAQQLFMSQPAVYQHVRQLEALLGTKLVEQRGKRVLLTEHGRALYEHAKRLDDQERDLIQLLRDDASLSRGSITVAAGTTMGAFVVPRISVGFRLLHPGIDVHVAVLGTPAQIDGEVLSHKYDVGFHSGTRETPGLVKAPFLEDEQVGIAPPNHPFGRSRRPLPPGVVAGEPLVMFATGPEPAGDGSMGASLRFLTEQWFANAGVLPQSRLAIGTVEGMKTAVRRGAGVALVSKYAISKGDMSLSTFNLASPPRRDFILVSRKGGWESNVVREFREYAESLAWLDDCDGGPGDDGASA